MKLVEKLALGIGYVFFMVSQATACRAKVGRGIGPVSVMVLRAQDSSNDFLDAWMRQCMEEEIGEDITPPADDDVVAVLEVVSSCRATVLVYDKRDASTICEGCENKMISRWAGEPLRPQVLSMLQDSTGDRRVVLKRRPMFV